jgi:chromosome segregation ATPase
MKDEFAAQMKAVTDSYEQKLLAASKKPSDSDPTSPDARGRDAQAIDALQSQLNESRNALRRTETALEVAKSEHKAVSEGAAQRIIELTAARLALSALEEEKKRLSDELKTTQQELELQSKQAAAALATVQANSQAQSDAYKQQSIEQMRSIEAQLSGANERVKQLTAELTARENELRSAQQREQQQRTQLTDSESERAAQLKSLQSELEAAKARAATSSSELDSTLQRLKDEQAKWDAERVALTKQVGAGLSLAATFFSFFFFSTSCFVLIFTWRFVDVRRRSCCDEAEG